MSRFLKLSLALSLAAGPVLAGDLGLGRPATDEEVAAWDIDIRPDGAGLPVGRGTVADGEMIFTDQCAVCHGDFGEAVGRWPQIAGGYDTLSSDDPVKTVGSYWPYLSTVWDYVHRAMPFGNAQSLTDDEVYALTAYILYLNDIVDDEDFELSNENFSEVEMPNAEGFYMDDRAEMELAKLSEEPCMENCKESVEITSHARVLDVTPEDAARRQAAEAAEVAGGDAAAPVQAAAAEAEPEAAPAEEAVEVASADPALIEAGENAFKKCKACHQVGADAKNRVGPQLNGIVGRAAGSIDDFRYSKAMAEAGENGLVWDHDALAEFLAKPRDYLKGTKMSFAGYRDEADIEAVIAYLGTFSE